MLWSPKKNLKTPVGTGASDAYEESNVSVFEEAGVGGVPCERVQSARRGHCDKRLGVIRQLIYSGSSFTSNADNNGHPLRNLYGQRSPSIPLYNAGLGTNDG